MSERDLYREHAAAVRRYHRSLERREAIETDEQWKASPRYYEILEVAEIHAEKMRDEVARLREELKASKKALDLIYFYAVVEHQKPSYTAKMVGYSERQVFRLLKLIQDNIREDVSK